MIVNMSAPPEVCRFGDAVMLTFPGGRRYAYTLRDAQNVATKMLNTAWEIYEAKEGHDRVTAFTCRAAQS